MIVKFAMICDNCGKKSEEYSNGDIYSCEYCAEDICEKCESGYCMWNNYPDSDHKHSRDIPSELR